MVPDYILPKTINDFTCFENIKTDWLNFDSRLESLSFKGIQFVYVHKDAESYLEYGLTRAIFQYNLVEYGLICGPDFTGAYSALRTMFFQTYNNENSFEILSAEDLKEANSEFLIERVYGGYTRSFFHRVPYPLFFNYPDRNQSLELILEECAGKLKYDGYSSMNEFQLSKYLLKKFNKQIQYLPKN